MASIVCAVDETDPAAERPLRVAADLAERLRLPLVVVHVTAPHALAVDPGPAAGGPVVPPGTVGVPYPAPSVGEEEAEDVRESARRRIERLVEQHGVASAAEVHVDLDPDPANGIRRSARERDAELIVLGSRGHGMLHDVLLGSTSRSLAGDAPCPVVVVPPADD